MSPNLELPMMDGSRFYIAPENVASVYAPLEIEAPSFMYVLRLITGKRYMVKADYEPDREGFVVLAEEIGEKLIHEETNIIKSEIALDEIRRAIGRKK